MFYYFYYDEQEEELIISKEKKELKGFREIIPLREDGREGRWRWGYDTASERIDELIARFMPNREIWGVFEKDYLKDRDTVTPTTSWTFKNVNSERGSEQFINLGFRKEIFPRPKPVGTLKRLLQIGASDDDIVLDFFSGSCSMAEAILRKNTEENTSIKYILVQLPEKCEEDSIPYKEGFNTISEIGKERIRRVGNKISQGELDLEESQTELELEPSNQESQSHDLGFKVFKLDKSNFKVWDSPEVDIDPGDLEEQLDVFADHISPEAEQESILYELILKSGYPLTTSIEEKELDGKTIYSIHDDALLIYLDDDLTFEILDQMAEMEPNRVVCLDKSFSGEQADALKTNAVQLFKSHDIAFRTV
ncbi:DNA methyltransferase [Fodinibius halophilus]|uniref:Site-specific DNA-methyltransferase n=1 Tax=Fodinibius halophilus TaxID=1736908 RepID=A0A6M1TCT9_9BACT|nr:DNA methyltransferase [Fodinibius halophilus]NGP90203.1 site-specific DNA-methyltransferase [Fodinibius halophilus]